MPGTATTGPGWDQQVMSHRYRRPLGNKSHTLSACDSSSHDGNEASAIALVTFLRYGAS
jgi:hypothetical protein